MRKTVARGMESRVPLLVFGFIMLIAVIVSVALSHIPQQRTAGGLAGVGLVSQIGSKSGSLPAQNPVIAYGTVSDSFGQSLKLAVCGDFSCTTSQQYLLDHSKYAWPGSIVKDTGGLPFIVYLLQETSWNFKLFALKCLTADCSSNVKTLLLDNTGNGVVRTSQVLVDSAGLPVFFYEAIGQIHNIRCTTQDCSQWQDTLVVSDPHIVMYGEPSAVLGSDGLPVFAYVSGTQLRAVKCGDINCNTISANSVIDTGIFFDEVVDVFMMMDIDLGIGSDGMVIGSYFRCSFKNSSWECNPTYLKTFHCSNLACTSFTVSTLDEGMWVGAPNEIIIGSDGLPLIAYWGDKSPVASDNGIPALNKFRYGDTAGEHLRVAHCKNIVCNMVDKITAIPITPYGVKFYLSASTGSDGLPVVVFMDEYDADMKVLHCSTVDCSNTINNILTIIEANAGVFASMAVG